MISIIIPAYNEEVTITKVIDELKEIMHGAYEIIVVDDGSKDKTAQIAKSKGVKLIRHPYNKGYGASLKTGIKEAKGDWLLIIDADGTYSPKEIPKLMKHMNEYDMIVGSRTGSNVHIPLLRRPAKFFLNKLANYLAGRRIEDLNSGMRLFKKEIALRFFSLFPSGFSFTTTITLASIINEYNVKYVPINYYKRKSPSTIHPIKDTLGFFVTIFRTITSFNPLKIFLPTAFIIFFAGSALATKELLVENNIADVPVFLVLAALQIALIGLLADLVARQKN